MTRPRKSARRPGRPATSPDYDPRDLLLAAASDLFAKQGVAGTTFAIIAKQAGMTPAMMHYYFKDRDQLLDAVVEERLAPLIASVWGPVSAGDSPEDVVSGVVERLLCGIEQMPWVPSTWMREVLNEGGLLRSRVLRHLPFDKVKILGQSMIRAQTAGELNSELDSGLIVFSVIGLVMLHMATVHSMSEILQRRVPSQEVLQRHIKGLLLSGLRPMAAGKQKAKRAKP